MMKNCLLGLVVLSLAAQVQAYGQAPAADPAKAPAAVSNASGWYYLPSGWYALLPAAPTAPGQGQTQPATARAASLSVPGTPLPYYVPLPSGPALGVAPSSWQHDNQNDNNWAADHGG